MPEAEQEFEDMQRSCAIIGPANSGKTTLLLAMQQACLQEQGDPYKLDFVPESKTAAELMSLAGEFLFHGQTVRASSNVTNYSFRVFVNNLEKQTPEYFCRLNVTDGPGGYLFPSERGSSNIGSSAWGSLVDATRQASSLVLCVDGSAPALETLYHGLPQLIFDLKGRQRRLPYSRALLLVTKIDHVVERFHEHASSYRHYTTPSSSKNPALDSLCFGPGSPLNAAKIAKLLDPVEQTRNLFGRLIDMIQAGLDPGAKFAVGLCSALGFHAQSGSAFINSTARSSGEAGSLAARFRDWEPFGVREAILFLVDDLIRHPIHEVPKKTAGFSAKSWNVRIPLHV
jgi:energy-coupling factor transporter ATP-binding protein EcfA2